MNYLAHLYLSPPDEDAWLGSLLGDFVKGAIGERFAPPVAEAIRLHRALDTFTDAHAAVQRSKSRVSSMRRRYAGIMIDMFYDHFLAKYWHEFRDEPLGEFSAKIYAVLDRRHNMLPDRLQYMAPRMAQSDWLASYAEVDSIHAALDRMGRRLKRENRLLNSADELLEHYPELEADFRTFMPQVLQFAKHHHLVAIAR